MNADRSRASDEPATQAFILAGEEVASETITTTYDHSVISNLAIEDKLRVLRHLLNGIATVAINDNNTQEFFIYMPSRAQEALVGTLLREFVKAHESRKAKNQRDVDKVIGVADRIRKHEFVDTDAPGRKLVVKARSTKKLTANHLALQDSIRNNDLTLVQGIEGTGKTSLSLGVALELLEKGLITRIVLIKPIVIDKSEERVTGAHKGGDVSSYFQNMFDLIEERIGKERLLRLRRDGVIQIFNFNIMHGMNFPGAFILLDEAQNCTPRQMRKVLTRAAETDGGEDGDKSIKPKIVITGDVDQKDTGDNIKNGLLDVLVRCTPDKIPESAQIFLGEKDILRPPIVRKIIEAYKAPDPAHPLYERWCKENPAAEKDIPLPAQAVRSVGRGNGTGKPVREHPASRRRP